MAFFYGVRPEGIEPSTNPWQGLIIPLNHGRNYFAVSSFCINLIQRISFRFKTVLPIIVFPTP
jgi:hypothetical protein